MGSEATNNQAKEVATTDRARFGWGFHDGASDKLRGNPHRTEGDHLFSLPSGDKAYREGYAAGFDEPADDSGPAWRELRTIKAMERRERQRIRDMRPSRF